MIVALRTQFFFSKANSPKLFPSPESKTQLVTCSLCLKKCFGRILLKLKFLNVTNFRMWWSISVPIVATYCPYFDLSRLWFPEMGGKRNASTTVANEGLFEPFIDSGADSSFVVEIPLSLVSGLSVFILLFCNTQNILASILNRDYFLHKDLRFKQLPYFSSYS